MHLPNRWAPGSIFALSGADHATSWAHPFVAAPEGDVLGLRLRVQPQASLRLTDPAPTPADLDPERCLCSNEILDVATRDGVRFRATFADRDTLVGDAAGARVALVPTDGPTSPNDGRGHLALGARETAGGVRFALGFDADSREAAERKAARGLEADLAGLLTAQRRWLEQLTIPAGLDETAERAYRKACAILRVNVYSPEGIVPRRWTTPDRWPHRHMWLWDSAFHAVGLRHLDGRLAEEALLSKLAMVRPDGYLAHMTGPDPAMHSVDTTQPPILAWAVRRVWETTGDDDLLRQAYEPLGRYVDWIAEHRCAPDGELVGWRINAAEDAVRAARGGESGWDNSPRFDTAGGMAAIDLSCQLQHEMATLAWMAERLGNPRDALSRSSLGAEGWHRRAARLAAAINGQRGPGLWDPETRFFYDRDDSGAFVKVLAGSGFAPLWAGVATPEQAEALVGHVRDEAEFWRPFPVPSVAACEPSVSDDMWRGPTWLNWNLLVIEGLQRYGYVDTAAALAERTLAEVARWYREDGTIYEYYDQEGQVSPSRLHRKGGVGAEGGVGFGVIRDYNWSAAVFVELANVAGAAR